MSYKKLTLVLAALVCVAAPLKAQTAQEGFFLNDYRLGYHFNPALAGGNDFISIGEFAKQNRNNIGAGSFLYPMGNEVLTFLSPYVSTAEFMSKLQDMNYEFNNYNYNLFAYGFARGEAFHTIELNARVMYGVSVPKDLFYILKEGTTDEVYNLSGARAQGQLFAELAYGYSRKLSDIVTLGGRAKLLLGLNSIDYRMSNLKLRLTEQEYRMDVDAELEMSGRNKTFVPTEDGYLSVLNMTSSGRWYIPTGAGLALDLGVVVTPNEYLTLSASVLDLGGICWSLGNSGRSTGTATFTGLDVAYNELNKDALIKKVKEVGEDFVETLKLKATGNQVRFNMIPLRANLGIKYKLPKFEQVHVGLVASYIGYQNMPYWEARYVMSCNPLDWLDFAGSFGYGAHGTVWGVGASVRVLKFRFNVGYEMGFGGYVGHSFTPVQPNNKVVSLGVTYDL